MAQSQYDLIDTTRHTTYSCESGLKAIFAETNLRPAVAIRFFTVCIAVPDWRLLSIKWFSLRRLQLVQYV